MPRRGAARGTRPLRWSVDLSPAEFAYVETARVALHTSRAEFVVSRASDVERRLVDPVPALAQARAVLQAEHELVEEADEAVGRDRYARGGRRPTPRLSSPEEIGRALANGRRQPWLATRLAELLAEAEEVDDGGA